jgi:D-sedoheptulose 7-phosphate isomerase
MKEKIISRIEQSIEVKRQMIQDTALLTQIEIAVDAIIRAYQEKKKVLLCGNGGSAADAQHIAAEFSGRFYFDRPPLYAEALHVNTSFVTAISNDYSFDLVYARMVEAAGKTGDILIALSTSGNSENIIQAIGSAKKKGMYVIGFTGKSGGKMKSCCDCLLNVPSADTPRIQEAHITLAHIICEFVEKTLFGIENF